MQVDDEDAVERAYQLILDVLEGRDDEAALLEAMLSPSQIWNLARAAVEAAALFTDEAHGPRAAEEVRKLIKLR